MSHNVRGSRPASSSATDGRLPSIRDAMEASSSTDQATGRSLAMQSILNPQAPRLPTETGPLERSNQELRRPGSILLQSPLSSEPPSLLPPQATTATLPSLLSRPRISSMEPHENASGRERRILGPRSPGIRAVSIGGLRAPSATINAHDSPFIPGVTPITSEAPLTIAYPTPTPPAQQRASYGFPVLTPSQPPSRRQSTSTPMSSTSNSVSPITPYGVPAQLSPTSSSHYESSYHSEHASAGHPFRYENDMAGPGGMPMIPFSTSRGDLAIPVDTNAASKAANEKRRRNANASARFRERKKAKETNMVEENRRLREECQELKEDCDFYQRDRDYLITVVKTMSDNQKYLPRPASPRRRRQASQAAHNGHGEHRNVRPRLEYAGPSPTRSEPARYSGSYFPNDVNESQRTPGHQHPVRPVRNDMPAPHQFHGQGTPAPPGHRTPSLTGMHFDRQEYGMQGRLPPMNAPFGAASPSGDPFAPNRRNSVERGHAPQNNSLPPPRI